LRSALQRASLAGVGGVLVAFLVAPVAALLLGTSWAEFVAGLAHPLVWPALRLSLLTSSASLACAVLLGTPLAWALSLSERRWARFIETLVELPIVIPPAVAGIALLLAFGRRGLFAVFYPPGWSLGFTTGAVVLAQLFVSAPFFVQAALSAFRRLDPGIGIVARTLGASPFRVFFRVAVPLGAPGLVAGALLAWARALGEFGATLMFAGNLEGKTQTLPLAIYTAFEADLRAAQALSIVLVAVATLLFWGVRSLGARRRGA
jgi:molybdate transport system permease protein